MTTSRAEYASAVLSGIGARPSADATRVMVAWMMVEGQTADENNPLAMLNDEKRAPRVSPGRKFTFQSIDAAIAENVRRFGPNRNYTNIGDAFRAGQPPAALIDTIHRAGWCGGPSAPCPAYGASIRSAYGRLADPATYAREAASVVSGGRPSGAAGSTPAAGAVPAGLAEDLGGAIVDGATGLGGTLVGPIGGAVGGIDALTSLAGYLISPAWWRRVGVFSLGATIALAGAALLFREVAPQTTGTIIKAARTAAKTAAVGAVAPAAIGAAL